MTASPLPPPSPSGPGSRPPASPGPFLPPRPPLLPPPTPRSISAGSPRRDWSPVGVVAAVGVAFILIAGLSVTIDRWDTIGATARVAGLALAMVAATFIADRVRAMAPTTALAVAVVGTGLAFPVGVATMAAMGFTWPVCLVVGAVVAAPLAEWQRRRWPALDVFGRRMRWFDIVQTATFAAGSFGLAALVHLPAGFIAVSVATILLAFDANWRSVGLAVLAVCAPVLGVLTDYGVGAGTLARAGVIGDSPAWWGPLVGIMGGGVTFIAGRRLGNQALQVLSPVLALIGLLTGLSAIDAGPATWLAVPGLALSAGAAAWRVAYPTTKATTLVNGAYRQTNAPAAALQLAAMIGGGLAAAIGFVVAAGTTSLGGSDAVTAAIWAVGLGLSWSILDGPFSEVALAGLAATATVAASALLSLTGQPFQLQPFEPAVIVAAVATVAAGAAIWFGRGIITAAVTLGVSLMAILALPVSAGPVAALTLLSAWLAVAVLALAWCRAPVSTLSVSGVGLFASYACGWIVAQNGGSVATTLAGHLFGVVVAAVAISSVRQTRRFLMVPVGIVASVVFVAVCLGDLTSPAIVGGFVAIAIGSLVWQRTVAGPLAMFGVGGAIGATAVSILQYEGAATNNRPAVYALVLIVAVVALSLWTWVSGRSATQLGAATAIGFAAAAFTVVGDLPSVWSAAVWLALGSATSAFAWRWDQPLIAIGGSIVAVVSASWVLELSGLFDWAGDALAVVGITTDDAKSIIGFVGAVALTEWLLHTTKIDSVWLYGPTFVYITSSVANAEMIRHPLWTIPFAVVVGVIAIVVGARRKITGLLLGGVALPTIVVVTASRATLVLVPGWAWIGLGGITLLGAALTIERVAGGWDGLRRQAAYLARTWR